MTVRFMELYILRHGIAEDLRPGIADHERALTAEGMDKLRATLKTAREAGVEPSLILSSPYRRAWQTAEIAREVLGVKEEILPEPALVPNGDPRDVWLALRTHKHAGAILLASHEPLCGYLMAHLLNAPLLRADVKKGALIRIDFDRYGAEPHGVLRWMLTARLAG
jgi:phosphohistidine phosphatase